jgi:RNA polymerase sigma-70 factor (ECF subfamily)
MGAIDLDTDLFNRYIAMYQRDLTRLCISLCRNVPDSEDLFQETWLKVMRKYGQYDESRPFDKWLFSVCVNTYKDSTRLFWRKRQMQFTSNEEKDFFLNSIPDCKGSNVDDYIALRKCVDHLPSKQKIVIHLIYFKDFTESDVAEILKIPVGTVKSRLHKAKKLLKEAFK